VDEVAPTGDEDRDFAELLNQFKAKLLAPAAGGRGGALRPRLAFRKWACSMRRSW
jgi:hypothetical protein